MKQPFLYTRILNKDFYTTLSLSNSCKNKALSLQKKIDGAGPHILVPGPGGNTLRGGGYGTGAIVMAGVGPVVAGASLFSGIGAVNPLAAGLVLAALLFSSALLWAFWRCKPGWCPCCASGKKHLSSLSDLSESSRSIINSTVRNGATKRAMQKKLFSIFRPCRGFWAWRRLHAHSGPPSEALLLSADQRQDRRRRRRSGRHRTCEHREDRYRGRRWRGGSSDGFWWWSVGGKRRIDIDDHNASEIRA